MKMSKTMKSLLFIGLFAVGTIASVISIAAVFPGLDSTMALEANIAYAPLEFTGSVSQGSDSTQHTFGVSASATLIEVELAFGPLGVFFDEIAEGPRGEAGDMGGIACEGVGTGVGHFSVKEPLLPQDAPDLLHDADRVGKMLEHMESVDLVEGFILEGPGKGSEIVDHIHARVRDDIQVHEAWLDVFSTAELESARIAQG